MTPTPPPADSALTDAQKTQLRALPNLSTFLRNDALAEATVRYGDGMVKLIARDEIETVRTRILNGGTARIPDETALERKVLLRLAQIADPLSRRALNATGILLHTGLGRAPLSETAMEHLAVMDHYSVLQVDAAANARNDRDAHVAFLISRLTQAEDAVVVNNNAAATMLVLNTLCAGKEAIVSRGQLVEIGGAFRIPDVMRQSSAVLREVGCTNRTHLRDYEAALSPETGAVLHVHTSNYRIRGFASMPDIRELCAWRDRIAPDVPVIDDMGGGALLPLSRYGLPDEPLIGDSVRAGCDIACFSGDKLLCGPQCGIIIGRKKWIEAIRKNPFMRMFRVCKLTLAAMESTLTAFVNQTHENELPLYQMLARPLVELQTQADAIADNVRDVAEYAGYRLETAESSAYMGSGSTPDEAIPSMALKLTPLESSALSLDALALRLRLGRPGIFARIENEALYFDMRTVFADECEVFINSLRAVLASASDAAQNR